MAISVFKYRDSPAACRRFKGRSARKLGAAFCYSPEQGVMSSPIHVMIESIDRRFGLVNRLPLTIEWLSDNGSPYTARETRALARESGLVPCTTPIESPQSNGMAEAFVKTLKRDYARVNPRPDAASVLRQLDGWFEHYNTIHPHKALGYRAPREFRKQLVKETTEDAVGAGR